MSRTFLKMHGLGNDFVVIDARKEPFAISPVAAKAIAERRRGIGCDTVVLIEPGLKGADARLRFFNADGSEAGACGNATRCIADLIFKETGQTRLTLDTDGGRLEAMPLGEGRVTVDMGAPKFDWQEIPLSERMDTRTLELQVGPIDDPILRTPSAVNLGNPHCIFFVDRVEKFDLARIGPMVEFHPLFPEQANISLAEIRDRTHIRLRVWERGIGITDACGTAACAAVAAAARRGMAERRVRVALDGGDLEIDWRVGDNHILMTGPTALSFTGSFDLDEFLKGAR